MGLEKMISIKVFFRIEFAWVYESITGRERLVAWEEVENDEARGWKKCDWGGWTIGVDDNQGPQRPSLRRFRPRHRECWWYVAFRHLWGQSNNRVWFQKVQASHAT